MLRLHLRHYSAPRPGIEPGEPWLTAMAVYQHTNPGMATKNSEDLRVQFSVDE